MERKRSLGQSLKAFSPQAEADSLAGSAPARERARAALWVLTEHAPYPRHL